MKSYRTALSAVFLLSAAALAGSFFAQYVLGLNPCPLCILQRVAVLAVFSAAALALLLPAAKAAGRTAAALLVSAPAAWGLYVAAYQIWLQNLPAGERPGCGAPWSFRLKTWPLFDYWRFVIDGFGDCGTREYVLGVPLPLWSLLFFTAVLLFVWLMLFRLRRRTPQTKAV